jgi:hypothetical protein
MGFLRCAKEPPLLHLYLLADVAFLTEIKLGPIIGGDD